MPAPTSNGDASPSHQTQTQAQAQAQPQLQLQATYRDSSDTGADIPIHFSEALPALHSQSQSQSQVAAAEPSTADKTAYLSALRTAVTRMQGEINRFLTQSMADEAKVGAKGRDEREVEEEENYGEEVVE